MDDLLEFVTEINFKSKNISIPSDLRPFYKISQIILVLRLSCYNGSSSLMKLQFFNWVFKSKNHYEELKHFSTNKFPIIRFDPSLNRAIAFAISEEILSIDLKNSKVKLTDKGDKLAELVLHDEVALVDEKQLLKIVKKKVSESYLERVFKERYRFDE